MKKPFLVGRGTRKHLTVLVLRCAPASPIHGPWTLKAVVSSN